MDPERDERSLEGQVLADRYEVARVVSSGANTIIVDAIDRSADRPVTVKIVRPELAVTPDFLHKFRRLAEISSALTHPNIASVGDWGEVDLDGDTTVYWTVEALGGGSMRDLLDRGRLLSPGQALVVGLEACRALDAAHQKGLFHTELTPSKMVFGADRRLRIVDFGLARLLGEPSWDDLSSVPTHVARYASPEQALGLPIDAKTDVYALSLVLLESVTGSVPFEGDSTQATLAARIDKLLPVSADLGSLASVLERAARPESGDRFTAAEFGRALVQAAGKLPKPEPIPILATGLFDTTAMRRPTDPTGGVTRPPLPPEEPDEIEPDSAGADDSAPDDAGSDDAVTDDHSGAGAAAVVAGAAAAGGLAAAAGHAGVGDVPGDGPDESAGTGSDDSDHETDDADPDEDGTDDPETTIDADLPTEAVAAVPTVDEVVDEQATTNDVEADATSTASPEVQPDVPAEAAAAGDLRIIEDADDGAAGTAGPNGTAQMPAAVAAAAAAATTPPTESFAAVPAASPGVFDDPDLDEPRDGTGEIYDDRPKRRAGPIVLLVVLALAGIAGLVYAGSLLFQTKSFAVPELAGTPEGVARNQIEGNDWTILTERERSDAFPEPDTVIRTDPGPGVDLDEGETITLVLSDGFEFRTLPDVTGLSVDAARSQLEALRLDVTEAAEREFSEDVPDGVVMRWQVVGDATLQAGAQILPGETVSVVVSMGPAPRDVPDLSNLTLEEATAALDGLQLAIAVGDELFSDDVEIGRIVTQSPSTGDQVERGATVTVQVSKGPDFVALPDLEGLTYTEAEELLTELGFEIGTLLGTTDGTFVQLTIDGNEVAPGTEFRRGQVVDVIFL